MSAPLRWSTSENAGNTPWSSSGSSAGACRERENERVVDRKEESGSRGVVDMGFDDACLEVPRVRQTTQPLQVQCTLPQPRLSPLLPLSVMADYASIQACHRSSLCSCSHCLPSLSNRPYTSPPPPSRLPSPSRSFHISLSFSSGLHLHSASTFPRTSSSASLLSVVDTGIRSLTRASRPQSAKRESPSARDCGGDDSKSFGRVRCRSPLLLSRCILVATPLALLRTHRRPRLRVGWSENTRVGGGVSVVDSPAVFAFDTLRKRCSVSPSSSAVARFPEPRGVSIYVPCRRWWTPHPHSGAA